MQLKHESGYQPISLSAYRVDVDVHVLVYKRNSRVTGRGCSINSILVTSATAAAAANREPQAFGLGWGGCLCE